METRITALTEEAVGLSTQLKSKTLTPSERKQLTDAFEETMALKTHLETELAKQQFLQDIPWTVQELDCPPEDQLMRGPIGAGGAI
jgi:hypothetical protein